ncbi:type I methionyl aminopeptidase [Alteribacillus sp. HJP-4]|uniref:type I methionyl aminopeptidase n=1 Tax=Alteribacillus sp. HJP-4 TaxID=2775394 RepID=UPI0035CD0A17
MIILKSDREIEFLRKPNQLVAEFHRTIAPMMKPGVSTWDIELFAKDFAKKHHAATSLVGYRNYPYITCASVNDVIAHGFPSKKPLRSGDLVTIDTVFDIRGWKGDSAWTYKIGKVSKTSEELYKVTKEALYKGIEQAIIGNRLGDIGHAIQVHAESHSFSVVRDLVGHGIGQDIHEEPFYLHIGPPGKGHRLKEGMVFTIEPMINAGSHEMYIEEDGWTARTKDSELSVQFEHTIAITKNGPIILTEQD